MNFKELASFFPGQKTWGAKGSKGTYVVLDDNGEVTATYQSHKKRKTIRLIPFEHPLSSFDEAEAICEAHNQK